MPAREITYRALRHPDPLVMAGIPRVLIEDPVADKLAKGDPAMGWSGDHRLALYLCYPLRQWELWRYEHDGQYRMTTSLPADGNRGIDVVARFVLMLAANDSHKGYDLRADLDRLTAKATKDREAKRAEMVEDVADHLAHALKKDGVA